MEEKIILVDIFDNPCGVDEKIEVHRQGWLHRAFSVFLYKENSVKESRGQP